jgi:hypothetical protein
MRVVQCAMATVEGPTRIGANNAVESGLFHAEKKIRISMKDFQIDLLSLMEFTSNLCKFKK